MPVREGDILDGRFELGRVAASGGMGVVYRGLDRQTGALVAVKTLRDTEGAERFRREVQVLSRLRHPGIVAYLGHGLAGGEMYLVMEWLEGEDLANRLAGADVSVEEALSVGVQIASALAAAHAQGIVHRDIKPSNVFLADFRLDRLKLLDYGIARHGGAATLTELGTVLGTPAFMSPEQARGDRDIDARADVYALGALLFRCLTGRAPFEAEGREALLSAVLHRPAPRVSDLTQVPRTLDELVARMLDKDPRRRPADGGAALSELSAVGGAASELSAVDRERAAVSALASTLIRGPPQSITTVRPVLSSVAVLPFLDMSAGRDQDYLCEGIAEELINTLTPLPGLRVAARSSSFALRSSEADARSIGRLLGVDAVLEGGVRKSGDRLRITVQLVGVADGSPRWSHRFDGTVEQVFEIQDQIAESVATALRGMLSTEERDALRRPGTRMEAYEHFLRGRQLLHQRTLVSSGAAERAFQQAIEVDPDYAPAYAGLTQVYAFSVEWMGGGQDIQAAADRASRRALELAPNLAESHVARGTLLAMQRDYPSAEREYEEAARLNPSSFDAYYLHGRACFESGKLERCVELFLKAAEVRPEDYQALLLTSMPLRRLGRLDDEARFRREGLRRVERQLELQPQDSRALVLGAPALLQEGHRERAFEWMERALEIAPDEASVQINAGCFYAQAGMHEKALDCLEKSFGRGAGKREWIEKDPDYDSLRDHPRFRAMLAKLR